MNDHNEDHADVSHVYRSLRSDMPPTALDQSIRQAARDEFRQRATPFRKYFIPVSIAASFILISAVLVNVLFLSPQPNQLAGHLSKQPMHMMQRSKPPAPEVMITQIEMLLDKNAVGDAGILHQKFRNLYPQYKLPTELVLRLQENRTISSE